MKTLKHYHVIIFGDETPLNCFDKALCRSLKIDSFAAQFDEQPVPHWHIVLCVNSSIGCDVVRFVLSTVLERRLTVYEVYNEQ